MEGRMFYRGFSVVHREGAWYCEEMQQRFERIIDFRFEVDTRYREGKADETAMIKSAAEKIKSGAYLKDRGTPREDLEDESIDVQEPPVGNGKHGIVIDE